MATAASSSSLEKFYEMPINFNKYFFDNYLRIRNFLDVFKYPVVL